MSHSQNGMDPDLWFIAQRWQQYEGEQRANVLRLVSVGAFYMVHLLNYYRPFGLFELDVKPDVVFHQAVTILAVAWTMLSLGVELCLRQQVFPRFLPYWTTGCDLLLLTAMLCVGSGESSPLVLGYPLIIILASLRVSLPMVQCATCGALAGYLFLMAWSKWSETFGIESVGRVPRYAQIMTLLAIALSGVILGQLVRGIRRMAEEFSSRRIARATLDSATRGNEVDPV